KEYAEKPIPGIKKPYLFYVGGVDSRKQVEHIIYAFNIARGRGLDANLVLAGNEFKKPEHIPNEKVRNAILSSPYRDDIQLVGFINDAEKKYLYSNADCF